MPVMELAAVRTVHLRMPNLPIVMLSMHDEPEFPEDARAAAAIGYVTKDCTVEELAQVLADALAPRDGGVGPGPSTPGPSRAFSDREREVLALLAEGANTAEIGRRLSISQKTVKNHLYSIYQKLEVGDRTQAVLQAMRIGLVSVA